MSMVSVIIPCYNQAQYLPASVRSVMAQTYAEWECLVINDGSTDETREVALALAREDSRIRYVEQNNKGLSGARNRGIVEAAGQFFQFLDADDLLDPEKFELQLKALSTLTEPAFAYCGFYGCRADAVEGEFIEPYLRSALDMSNPLHDLAMNWERELSIPVHCFLFDARLFRDHNIRFDESLPNHEDWECWMHIFASNPQIAYVDRKLAFYVLRDDSMCRNSQKMRAGFIAAIRKQRKLQAHDKVLSQILAKKLKLTAWESHEDAPFLSRALWKIYIPLHGFAVRLVPESTRLRLNRLRGKA